MKFTKSRILSIPAKATRQHFRDPEAPGLLLRVHPSGAKAWAWFRKVCGHPTYKFIGNFPEVSVEQAKSIAGDYNTKLTSWKAMDYDGAPPFQKRTRVSVGQAWDVYREEHLAKKRRVKGVVALFDAHFASLKGRSLSSLTSEEMSAMFLSIESHYVANHAFEILRAVINFAIKRKLWRGLNPVDFPLHKLDSRERYLLPAEWVRLNKALSECEDVDLHDFILLALFTGARRSNLETWRWDEITEGVWTIPAEKSKSGHAMHIPLIARAQEILEQRRYMVHGEPRIFPRHLDYKDWLALCAKANIKDLQIHDLRRSLATYAAGSGVSLYVIKGMLGHTEGSVTGRYARLDLAPVKVAMDTAITALLGVDKPVKALFDRN